jgi:hypothetical protein
MKKISSDRLSIFHTTFAGRTRKVVLAHAYSDGGTGFPGRARNNGLGVAVKSGKATRDVDIQMTKDNLSMLLTQSEPGESLTVGADQLASHFPPRAEGRGVSGRGLEAAAQFAEEHNCDFSFDPRRREGTFTKRPTPHPLAVHFSAMGA